MPRGDKSKYTDKQRRKAAHIEEGYRERGVSKDEAVRRAWATVNASDRGGKKAGGSGQRKATSKASSKKGGQGSAARPKASRVASVIKRAARNRQRQAQS